MYAVTVVVVVVVVENSVTGGLEERGRGHRYFERRTREREGAKGRKTGGVSRLLAEMGQRTRGVETGGGSTSQ